ncbi:MAG: peptidase T [Bacteroidetes bacterium RIFCSPLOWO2_12_FULL_37_12]|nr:MAG: peptidase T [Bacteroidetes bacterium RIFCSPLOWO2_12_FULL_37_12]
MNPLNYTVTDRFLRYVKIDTQSDPNSTTIPSTLKQKDLGELLVKELHEIGIKNAQLDEWGYVYAELPSNSPKNVPVICFCSHIDTSPDCSGKNVKPVIHKKYKGNNLKLPGNTSLIIRKKEHDDLKNQLGNDIITSDGTTLLGADNKAGLAEIMDAVFILVQHPEIKHGTIKILFTPDEEIGRGVDKVDMKKLGAVYGYTIDGESRGTLEDETFSADAAVLTVHGVSTHPGFGKGKLVSAIKILSQIISALPKDKLSPETTEDREGFIHPMEITGNIEKAVAKFIIRDFTVNGLKKHEKFLKELSAKILKKYPTAKFTLEINEQYRNMKEILAKNQKVVLYALEAIKRAGMKPKCRSIRGGTDGSRLSFMGLPCPNLFAGEHAFHSLQEWVSVQDMEKAVDVIINLCQVWEEKS